MLLTECPRKVFDYGKTRSDSIHHAIDEVVWVNLFWHKSINEQVTLFNRTTLNIFRKFIPNKITLQLTLSVSITLYLEYLSISISVPWNFPKEDCIAFLYFELLYLELFPISNKFSGPLNHFLSLSRTSAFSKFISNSRIKSNLNQKENFDRKWK